MVVPTNTSWTPIASSAPYAAMRNATSEAIEATNQPAASSATPRRSRLRSSIRSKARPRIGEHAADMIRNIVQGIWPSSREVWNALSNCGASSGKQYSGAYATAPTTKAARTGTVRRRPLRETDRLGTRQSYALLLPPWRRAGLGNCAPCRSPDGPLMCHDLAMSNACAERFNRTAEGYLRWWAPVLAPASVRLVDRVGRMDPGLPSGKPRDVLDIGSGTGTGLFEAARRWPGARLTGLDASVGMLDVARREQGHLPESARERISYVQADAAVIPASAASFDLVTTCFVLQQVPDRAPVLRDIHRVLRSGGILAIYGWVKEKVPFAPEAELENALAETGVVRPPSKEVRSGHYGSLRGAAGSRT